MTVRRSPADMELDDLHDHSQKPKSSSPVQSIPRSEPTTLRLAPSPATAHDEHDDDQQELLDAASSDQENEVPPTGGKSRTSSRKKAPGKKAVGKKEPAKKSAPKSSPAKLTPVSTAKSQPWLEHRISESNWNSLPVYDLPITTDEDVIKAELLPNRFLKEYNAIMGHENSELWKKEWQTLDGQTFRTIDLATNELDVKYRTPDNNIICTRAPQLWTIYPLSHNLELDKLKLITFDQEQKDVEALVLNYVEENKKLNLGFNFNSIQRHANMRYQSLMCYLLFRENKLAEMKLAQQKNIQRRERVISKASPLLALAPSLAKWVAKHGKLEEKK